MAGRRRGASRGVTPRPQKNTTGKPRKPPADVRELQDPEYDEGDFDRDLERATKRLDEPESPAPRKGVKRLRVLTTYFPSLPSRRAQA